MSAPTCALLAFLLCLGQSPRDTPAAPAKNVTGFFVLRPSHGNLELAQSILASKKIAGVSLRDRWINVEPQPGVYNFDRLRAAALKCRQAGKVYTILVESGAQSPLWLKAQGAKTVTVAKQKWDQTNQLPVPWDAVFLRHYRGMVKALGDEFDHDPACVCVVAGGPNRRSNELNLSEPAIARLPDSKEKFVGAWFDCLNFYAESFPRTPVSLQMGVSFAGKQATQRIAKYHADNLGYYRACFQWCALNAKPGATDYEPYVLTALYGGKGYVSGAEQVQATTFTTEYGGSGTRQQKFDYSMNRLRNMGGDFAVVYEADMPLLKSTFVPK